VAKDVKSRSGDQCWKRWNDSLDPQLNHSQWQPFEDAILEQAVLRSGRMWSKIATENLPGRSGLSCKNRWDHIQRKQRRIYQSQREVLHGHSSSRSFIDSAIDPEQSRLLSSNNAHFDIKSGRTSSHSRFPSFGEGFSRHAPSTAIATLESHQSPLEHGKDDDNSRLMASTGGAHFYKSVLPRANQPRSFAPLQSSSWGGFAGQGKSTYAGHHSSFSSPKAEVQPPKHSFSSSSPYPGPTLGGYVSQLSSSNAPRSHAEWLAAPAISANQPASLMSVSELGVCTGGMLTYNDDIDTTADSSAYSHHYHGESSVNQNFETCRTSSGFATSSISTSAPDQSSRWPRPSLLDSTPRYSYASNQAALWTSKGAVTDARAYTMTSSFYSRQASSQQETMYDDREPPRKQQLAPAITATDTATSHHWKDSHEWQQQPASRDGFSSTDACQAAKTLSSQHPFAYSTEEFAPDEEVYSTVSHATQQESRAGLEIRGSIRPESPVGMATTDSIKAVDALYQSEMLSAHSPPRILKVEDMTHNMFYDDVQCCSQSRQPEERYQDDEVTSEEEEEEQVDLGNDSGSIFHHTASSQGSPLEQSTTNLL
jgi:hypothetical protein